MDYSVDQTSCPEEWTKVLIKYKSENQQSSKLVVLTGISKKEIQTYMSWYKTW